MNELDAEVLLIKEKINTMGKNIDELYGKTDQIVNLNTSIMLLNNSVERLEKVVNDMSSKPSKRYDTIVTVIISTLVGGLIGYFLMKLGLK